MPIHGYPGNVITANPTAPTVSSASGVWTTEQQLINQSAGRWPMAQTQVSRSLRFNSADTAYLSRTNTNSPTSTTKFTYSVWVKRGALSIEQLLLMPDRISASSSVWDYFGFDAGDTLTYIYDGSLSFTTTAVFRDVSAWYHIVLQYDSTLSATKCWVNNALLNTGSLTLNRATTVNGTARPQNIGRYNNQSGSPEDYFNGYMTEINMIDGLALDPSYFGFNNSDTGVWSPKQYTGTYGTNGFYLNFSDNSNTTAATLGKDYSGNGNNWTPNNFSVTAGSGNDSLVDSPTSYGTDTGVGGTVRGNYATFNPINLQGSNTSGTVTDGNLKSNPSASAGYTNYLSSIAVPATGYWYAEFTVSGTYQGANNNFVGIQLASSKSTTFIGNEATTYGYGDGNITTGSFRNNGTISQSVAGFQTGDTLMVAIGNGGVWFGKNGTWLGTGSPNPATSTSPAYSGLSGDYYFAYSAYGTAGVTYGYSSYANFGQRPFAYTPPTGFRSLCTTNLPTTAIGFGLTNQGDDYFDVTLYAGNNTAGRNITNSGSFQPDFVWIKNRSGANNHILTDAVRGATKSLFSDSTSQELTVAGALTAFNSNGFQVGYDGTAIVNATGSNYVGWQWKASGSTVTNTAGTITSTVSANTTAGFAIATTTGAGSTGTIGHGLGAVPQFIMCFRRNTAADHYCYHQAIGNTNYLVLNTTAASAASANMWNNTTPTSTVFSVGNTNNNSGDTYVHYIFAPVPGYSAFGSYTGNGNADGPFIYTGFRPRYFMLKNITNAQSWSVQDTSRNPYNVGSAVLIPNLSNAEATGTDLIDIVSNGVKIRHSSSGNNNNNGDTYIYAAFAENPFKYSLAR